CCVKLRVVRLGELPHATFDPKDNAPMNDYPLTISHWRAAVGYGLSASMIGPRLNASKLSMLTFLAATALSSAATAQSTATVVQPQIEAPSCAGVPLSASPGAESPLVDPAKDLRGAVAAGQGDRDWGEYLASECLTCHGLNAEANADIPPLARLAPMDFASALEEYRRHLRPDLGMRLVAAQLTPDEVAAIIAYFASLPPSPATP
uniref:c-type cytochrome n=1 Tax=Phaeovulum sp. TaxID=2934796 RepID=UPI00356B5273